jgi:hypothetical protein
MAAPARACPEIPDNPMMNMKPNSLISGARYDRVMEAFGGKGFYVEDPRDLQGAFAEAVNFKGPALVNCLLSKGSASRSSSAGTADSWRLRRNKSSSHLIRGFTSGAAPSRRGSRPTDAVEATVLISEPHGDPREL